MATTSTETNVELENGSVDATQPAVDGETAHAAVHGSSKPSSRKKLLWLFLGIGLAIILVTILFAWYLITHKPLTALPGISSDGVPRYSYSIYGVTEPLGVAVTPDGAHIYVTQSGGTHDIKEFDRSGKLLDTLAPPAATGPSHIPLYVALDPKTGNVYQSDRLTSSVYVYDPSGHYVRTFKPVGVSGKWMPMGLAFDALGRLYVTEALETTSRILVFNTSGQLLNSIATPSPMSFPNGIAVSSNGTVAVTDSNNGRAFLFDSNGKLITLISGGMAPADLGLPRGVAFDSQGHIDVVDTTNQAVRVYKLGDGAIKFVGDFGDQGIGEGLFMYPNGAAVDGRAAIYVTDRVNNRVQVWRY
jgi:tripartite motif-containing protein 71